MRKKIIGKIKVKMTELIVWRLCLFCAMFAAALPIERLQARDTRDDYESRKEGTSYQFGDGVHFQYNENNYHLAINGYTRISFSDRQAESKSGPATENSYRIEEGRVSIGANAVREKISFFLEFNIANFYPIDEAWISFHLLPNILYLSVGQKHTFTNNRVHYSPESKIQLTKRSPLSEKLTSTGREFGLFLEAIARGKQNWVVKPSFAITTGDGRNSFGGNFTDPNVGALKYGTRLDILPLGEFARQGDYYAADTSHEEKPKLALGLAYSINQGASDPRGEGRATIQLYDAGSLNAASTAYPDYTKLYFDFLAKYRGFSFLLEYATTKVSSSKVFYSSFGAEATNVISARELPSYYALGTALNLQFSYIFKNGSAISFFYTDIRPEQEEGLSLSSRLQRGSWYTIGFSQYFTKKLNSKFSMSYTIEDGQPYEGSEDTNQNDFNVFRMSVLVNF